MEVIRLKRIREGMLSLGDLPTGKWRHLTREEASSSGKTTFCNRVRMAGLAGGIRPDGR